MIVTICGSTKFKDEILLTAKQLTFEGLIVLLPLVYAHSGDSLTEKEKINLDKLHMKKIDMSELIIVVTVDGYFGESTKNEIIYALKNNKMVMFENYKREG